MQQMRKRADELVAEAERQGAEARKTAENLVANARTEAERIVARARNEAQTLAGQTQAASAEQNQQGDVANDSEEGDGKRRRRRLWGNKES
jgi:F0F1-type ATP synthase membrane subunit b/b'